MIFLIAGASHAGKTVLAQKLLEKYKYPYLSIDLLKMGLIRSKNTDLTVEDDDRLTPYLWQIVREMIRTAIENRQNLIVEGCYIPFDWKKDFSKDYLSEIRYCCIVLGKEYIANHFPEIKAHANDVEQRLDDSCCTVELLQKDNEYSLEMCQKYGCRYVLVKNTYDIDEDTVFGDGEWDKTDR